MKRKKSRKTSKFILGHNQDRLFESSGNVLLDFFSKAGSLRSNKEVTSYYGEETTALDLFKKAWQEDKVKAMKLLFWLRDRSNGAGNRSGFRDCITWLAQNHYNWIETNISLIPLYGRWDDLKSLYDTPVGVVASDFWAKAIIDDKNILACKWAKREDKNLQKALNINEAELRKLLSSKRSEHIVENKMCSDRWNEIDYKTIPSVAMSRYTKAFNKHDYKGFEKYKKSLENTENITDLIHADVLFPYNCLVTAKNGDKAIADAQFSALPNFMEKTNYKILPICDFSGSMDGKEINEEITILDVCKSLGLYCSDRLEKDNPFYRKFLEFSDDYEIIDWSKQKFSDAINCGSGNCANTNIEKALNGLLNTAKMFSVKPNHMPNVLLFLSDIQFDSGTQNSEKTVVDACMDNWKKEGYNIPKIIYWNLAGYAGSPSKAGRCDVALVSGFSPSILTSVLEGEDFSPIAIMNRTIEKYKINVPK
jgi:hypothetical protein